MWQTTGTTTASTCGHTIPVQEATNDRGEHVTRIEGYPDPDAKTFQFDAYELCHDCYCAKMDRQMRPMTAKQLANMWRR